MKYFQKWLFGIILLGLTLSAQAAPVNAYNAQIVARNFYIWNVRSLPADTPLRLISTAYKNEVAVYYIFNVGQVGFVIVAADDRATPILGWSNEGVISLDNPSPEWTAYMSQFSGEMYYIISHNLPASKAIADDWTDWQTGNSAHRPSNYAIAPLLQTTWDQLGPYNNICPMNVNCRAYTGCVATAMAQIMNYWRWPSVGTGNKTYTDGGGNAFGSLSANFGATTYDWLNMTNAYSGASTAAENSAVATLMYQCGVAVSMNYGCAADGGSSSYTVGGDPSAQDSYSRYFYYTAPTLKSKSSYSAADWLTQYDADLEAGRPVHHRGTDDNGNGGHSWVCDGRDVSDMYHMNWGWSGSNNGYFVVTALNAGGYAFNTTSQILTGIQPNGCGISTTITNDVSTLFNSYHYQYHNDIYSTAVLNTGVTRTYDAGVRVVLQPGFIAPEGVVFRAYIDGCLSGRPAPDANNAGAIVQVGAPSADRVTAKNTANTLIPAAPQGLRAQPNPFFNQTLLTFEVVEEQEIMLEVFNSMGQSMNLLIAPTTFVAGTYQYTFDGQNYPSGIYTVVLSSPSGKQIQKIALMR